jgi:hypothetical protein
MSAKKPRSKRKPPASTTDATERLAAIVEAAEQAASAVLDRAEREAGQRLQEAEARANSLAAERLREIADELDPPEREAQAPKPRLRSVEPSEEPEAGGDEKKRRRSTSSGARLLATQMAVSGADRKEIESRLRSDFEVEDTSEILDAILGPEE